jgi:hypothetical protein
MMRSWSNFVFFSISALSGIPCFATHEEQPSKYQTAEAVQSGDNSVLIDSLPEKPEKRLSERAKSFAKGLLCASLCTGSVLAVGKVLCLAYQGITTDYEKNLMERYKDDIKLENGEWLWIDEYDIPNCPTFQSYLTDARTKNKKSLTMLPGTGIIIALIGYVNYKILIPEAKKNLQEAFS